MGDKKKQKKLKLKIKEVFDTQEAFAEAMGMTKTPLSLRLNGKIDWRMSEIAKASDLLNIPLTDTYLYF